MTDSKSKPKSKPTPLSNVHRLLGAKMAPFAGFEMPIEYAGIMKEHEAVRSKMGLFDVSHMGEIEVRGHRALDFCQRISTNDVSRLKPGKVQYNTICNEAGGILDDCTVYRLSEEHFLFVVNAGSKDRIAEWFAQHPLEGADVSDRSDDYALLALQGKKAEALLGRVAKRDLRTVAFYEFTWAEIADSAVLISRTGYTGEDGFELYLAPQRAKEIWDLLLNEGKEEGLVPVGLGARDTLRLEMGYLLYGSDMNASVNPLEAGLSWVVKLGKGFFVGREALIAIQNKGTTRRIRGLRLTERGIPRAHCKVQRKGRQVGEVTSGTFSPSLRQGIALAYLETDISEGSEVEVVIRDRQARAVVVRPPFVAGSLKR